MSKQFTRTMEDGRVITARQNGGIRKRCGCPRSSWLRCSHPWHANYSFRGREYRVSLHKWAGKPADYEMLQGEAKSLFSRWKTAIEDGEVKPAKVEKMEAITLDAIATMYIDEYANHPDRRRRAAKEMERQTRCLCDAEVDSPMGEVVRLGAVPMSNITRPLIEAFRNGRRQAHERHKAAIADVAALREAGKDVPEDLLKLARRGSMSVKAGRVSTNRLLSRLRHVFSWAIAEKGLIESTPFEKGGVTVIKMDGKAETGRSRRFANEDEETRLLAHAGAHLHACITATLEAGLRKGEILGLTWQDIYTEQGVIMLPGSITKNGLPRQAIISPKLAATLDMRRAEQRSARELKDDDDLPGDLHPFGNEIGERVGNIQTAWRLTCKRAGITDLHFHDLRREAGSRVHEAPGVSLADTRDFLGHRDVGQTNKYLSSSTARLREAVRRRDESRTNLAQPPIAQSDAKQSEAVTH